MPLIQEVTGRQILDSKGVPTVEVSVTLDNGVNTTSSSPSGSRTSNLEALELRDQNQAEYFGLGVSKAVENVNTAISQALVGMDPLYQTQVDQTLVNLDGTANKSRLGSNAILATSQAVMKAAAASLKLPLFIYIKEKYQLISAYRVPTPMFNLINGGKHGSNTLDFQEFQVIPASHLPFHESLRIGAEIFMALEKVLEQKGAIRAVGMEGGFSPNLAANTDVFEIFEEAFKLANYTPTKEAFFGLDASPGAFYKGGKYILHDRPQPMDAKAFIRFYQDLHQQFRVFAFEDPLMPDAWADWKFMTSEMGETAMIMADDLIATNKTLLMKAIQEKACNAAIIKPNRVGTITEAIEIAHIAKDAGWHTVISHRSGETTDDFLADLAVGIGADYVKFGATSRGERVVKYNRLLRIEEILLRSKEKQEQRSGDQFMDNTSTDPMQSAAPTFGAPAADSSAPAMPSMPSAAPAAAPTEPSMPSIPLSVGTSDSLTPTPVPEVAPVAAPPAMPAAPAVEPAPAMDPLMPPAAAPEPEVTISVPTSAPAEETPADTSTEPAPAPSPAPAAPVSPALPQTPAGLSAVNNPAAVPGDVGDIQASLNQLAGLVGESGAPAAPATAPSAPDMPAAPAAMPSTEPAANPAGLTPPTPPNFGVAAPANEAGGGPQM